MLTGTYIDQEIATLETVGRSMLELICSRIGITPEVDDTDNDLRCYIRSRRTPDALKHMLNVRCQLFGDQSWWR